jgi:hypothetical protein
MDVDGEVGAGEEVGIEGADVGRPSNQGRMIFNISIRRLR